MRTVSAVVMAVIAAAVIIFSVVSGVKGLFASALSVQAQALAEVDKGGAQ